MRTNFVQGLLALSCFIACLACPRVTANPLTFQKREAPSGNVFNFMYLNGANLGFTTVRPSKDDKNVLLCFPAAFTMRNGKIGGIYIVDGKVYNKGMVDRGVGGAAKMIGSRLEIFPTDYGKLLTDELLNDVAKQNGTLFQQFQVVENGSPAKFKDKSSFQRRGIAVLQDGTIAVVESVDSITLTSFADDAAALKVRDLIYTDMGAWGEGWVRNPKNGEVLPIGNDRQMTDSQTNWVVVTEAKAESKAEPKSDAKTEKTGRKSAAVEPGR